ncbi:MAG: hypothetical protein U5L95_03930 [Candidatus Saccharibacteria bacterium]|nr:hypothetical protein [Candidatus Saccharibacteria bacterium]
MNDQMKSPSTQQNMEPTPAPPQEEDKKPENPKEQPKPPKKPKGKKVLVVFLVLIALAVIGVAGYYLLNEKDKQLAAKDEKITALKEQVATLQSEADSADTSEEASAESESSDSEDDTPIVVFTPGGQFDDALKKEIRTKLINPYVDYQQELSGKTPATIHVQHSVVNSGETDLVVDVIYPDEVVEGFLYGDNTQDTQPWYEPTCLDQCEFSEEYQKQYPEVVTGATP